jgi:glycerol-3-phosphate acyltransferase PlsY
MAYLIGSLPTALIVSRKLAGKDIREMGDGNMGARNTTHVLGWKAGILVAIIDFGKGALVILLCKEMAIPLIWQLAAGVCVVLGHDFSIFAQFRGGQGMATSLGTMGVLFIKATLIGLIIFGLVYLITHHFDLSAGIGLGSLVAAIWNLHESHIFIVYAVLLFLMIPAKKFWHSRHPYFHPLEEKNI